VHVGNVVVKAGTISPGGSARVSLAPVREHRMASAGHTDCANPEAVRTACAKVTTLIKQAIIVIRLKVREAPSVARLTLRHPSIRLACVPACTTRPCLIIASL